MMKLPSLVEIEWAAGWVRSWVVPTPVYRWPRLESGMGGELWMKHENHTPVGAFKIRGGLVYMEMLRRESPEVRGVIAASTGNHGQSVAFSAKAMGLRAVIVVPRGNPPTKNEAMRALGAELIEHGEDFQSALEFSRALAGSEGLHAVPSFHPWLVQGVATYGLELFRSAGELDVVFVPIGLGSGFCGVAAAREALGFGTKLVGVVSSHAPAMARSFREGRLVEHPSTTRWAEGVACRRPNEDALALVLEHAEAVVEVDDDAVLGAVGELVDVTHNLAEGAGALAYAAFKQQQDRWAGARVGCVLSGGNASVALLKGALGAV